LVSAESAELGGTSGQAVSLVEVWVPVASLEGFARCLVLWWVGEIDRSQASWLVQVGSEGVQEIGNGGIGGESPLVHPESSGDGIQVGGNAIRKERTWVVEWRNALVLDTNSRVAINSGAAIVIEHILKTSKNWSENFSEPDILVFPTLVGSAELVLVLHEEVDIDQSGGSVLRVAAGVGDGVDIDGVDISDFVGDASLLAAEEKLGLVGAARVGEEGDVGLVVWKESGSVAEVGEGGDCVRSEGCERENEVSASENVGVQDIGFECQGIDDQLSWVLNVQRIEVQSGDELLDGGRNFSSGARRSLLRNVWNNRVVQAVSTLVANRTKSKRWRVVWKDVWRYNCERTSSASQLGFRQASLHGLKLVVFFPKHSNTSISVSLWGDCRKSGIGIEVPSECV
jgi:hypothetical protein